MFSKKRVAWSDGGKAGELFCSGTFAVPNDMLETLRIPEMKKPKVARVSHLAFLILLSSVSH